MCFENMNNSLKVKIGKVTMAGRVSGTRAIVLNYHGFRLTTNSIVEDSSSKHGFTSSGLICRERVTDLILNLITAQDHFP